MPATKDAGLSEGSGDETNHIFHSRKSWFGSPEHPDGRSTSMSVLLLQARSDNVLACHFKTWYVSTRPPRSMHRKFVRLIQQTKGCRIVGDWSQGLGTARHLGHQYINEKNTSAKPYRKCAGRTGRRTPREVRGAEVPHLETAWTPTACRRKQEEGPPQSNLARRGAKGYA